MRSYRSAPTPSGQARSPLLFLLPFVFANFRLAAFSTTDKVQNPIKEFAGSQVSYGFALPHVLYCDFVG